MNTKKFVRDLIDLFADRTGCGIQYKGCPCNACFHSLKGDFRHICWLILLGLRGDYEQEEIISSIEKELI